MAKRKSNKNELESAIAAISEGLELLKTYAAYANKPVVKPVVKSAKPSKIKKGTFKDPRDGKVYKTVKIGGQTWLAENLNFEAEGSKCYDNDPKNAEKYGRLYNWETAKKACPPGWHLPTNEEWQTLIDCADGFAPPENYDYKRDSETAGKKLKATSGWNKSGNGTDKYGFSALPGGYGNSDGSFLNVGSYGYWWSAYEDAYGSYSAYYRDMLYSSGTAYWHYYFKSNLRSVRCVQDKEGV
ncbi:MAG: fibrobacter succinogenes major paralogous domain-containing protein [Candidatus Fibromonas sp.]|jgi:uncharacterized protein (TIGR02145 family)|nr:fibrobacter succinogenes major paralogous domain-containing protein [Candidatus Fibromonas sp.]